MTLLKKIIRSNFIIRLSSWEYWPFGIVQFPLFIYWFWLSIRARSFFFFSASNPGITNGGMFGESKHAVLKGIPAKFTPASILIKRPCTLEEVLNKMKEAGLRFPVIFKPDIGERGWMVARIDNESMIGDYLKRLSSEFIIQEFVDLPYEFGVFYRRYPSEANGKVISIVAKEMLTVTGNGISSLKDLILQNERAKLQWKKLSEVFQRDLQRIVPIGETIELVSIGNHARGTKFLNGNYLINDQLSAHFDAISKQISGFYFGRFDLRTASLQDFNEGKVKILELNGCGAEPAHIYDPQFGLLNAVKVLFAHWDDIFRISRENHKRGIKYISLKEEFNLYRKFKSVVR